MNFNFIIAVWGSEFTDFFLRVVLPSQLTPGNLLAIAGEGKPVYRIHTTAADAEVIRASPAWRAVEELMATEICTMDDILTGPAGADKFTTMNECHKRAIQSTMADPQGVLIILAPDAIFSDGTFARLYELGAAGKRGVLVVGIRLLKESATPVIMERYSRSGKIGISIEPRELVKLAVDHLHPLAQSNMWDSPTFTTYPSHIYWPVGREGIIVRGFHLHPLMLNPVVREARPTVTIDADYLHRACPDYNDLHIVTNSDELVGFELSPITRRDHLPTRDGEIVPHRATVEEVGQWISDNADACHRHCVLHEVRLLTAEVGPAWDEVSESSSRTIVECMQLYRKLAPRRLKRRAATVVKSTILLPRRAAGYVRRKIRKRPA